MSILSVESPSNATPLPTATPVPNATPAPTATPAPVPTATPAPNETAEGNDNANAPEINYDPSIKEESPAVLAVRKENVLWDLPPDKQQPCEGKRGDELWFDVVNLERWLYDNGDKTGLSFDSKTGAFTNRDGDQAAILKQAQKLFPIINGNALKGLSPNAIVSWKTNVPLVLADGTVISVERRIHYLRYTLTTVKDNQDNQDAWHRLWKNPTSRIRRMEATLGLGNGAVMPSGVTLKAQHKGQQFYLVLLPGGRLIVAGLLVLISLLVFLRLASSSDLLRDPYATLRPDGQHPFSLASTQMAYWFFTVVTAFLFLWLLTGALDCLNPTALTLIGISSVTGLASKWIKPAGNPDAAAKPDYPPVNINQPRKKIRVELDGLIQTAKNELAEIQAKRGQIAAGDAAALSDNAAAAARVTELIDKREHQRAYFQQPAWRGFMLDLLAEENSVSFHRFQIVVWTTVLGLMFISNVLTELTMPEFSATTLGLLGISAGTYLGFKLPDR